MQKVGGGTSPTAAFEHKLLDAGCQWVSLDNPFDDGGIICFIGGHESGSGHSTDPQAVAHRAKSAIRGNVERLTLANPRSPHAVASNRPARMRGCAIANSCQSSPSDRRSYFPIGANVRKMLRSAKSGWLITSSMPLTSSGRAA